MKSSWLKRKPISVTVRWKKLVGRSTRTRWRFPGNEAWRREREAHCQEHDTNLQCGSNNDRASTKDYFHLIIFLDQLISCLDSKMSKNGEKCWRWRPEMSYFVHSPTRNEESWKCSSWRSLEPDHFEFFHLKWLSSWQLIDCMLQFCTTNTYFFQI